MFGCVLVLSISTLKRGYDNIFAYYRDFNVLGCLIAVFAESAMKCKNPERNCYYVFAPLRHHEFLSTLGMLTVVSHGRQCRFKKSAKVCYLPGRIAVCAVATFQTLHITVIIASEISTCRRV
jgi:hypothetical protein